MKIKEILEYGKNNLIKEDAYRLSKMLLKHFLNVNNSYIVINSEEEVNLLIEDKFKEGICLLNKGIPIQYITNYQEFMGLDFYVDSNVLIPQPDTEILVEEVLEILKKNIGKKDVLDLCTGSGAIGISIAKNTNVFVTMSDISNKALEVAKKNSINHKVMNQCRFVLSNMFDNIIEKYDVIVSNPPYIETSIIKTLDQEVQNEPHLALDGGEDGLDFYKIIAENAYKYLNNDGVLALEIGYDQKDKVINILKQTKKYTEIYSKKDLGGNNRIIRCRKLKNMI